MRPETKNIISDLELLFPGESYSGHRVRIEEAITKAEIKKRYHEQLAIRAGESQQIKIELAKQFHISVTTVEKYVHRI